MKFLIYLLFLINLIACSAEEKIKPPSIVQPPNEEIMFFPSNTNTNWETKSLASLGWNKAAIQPLKDFLIQKNTKSFMILINGRIVLEEYFNGHTANTTWEWNSAGKTLVASTVGIAQEQGFLNINNKASDYLGNGWTSMTLAQENLITVKNLLTMTVGNDDTKQSTTKPNLTYIADAVTRWAYSNIFQKLIDVVNIATNQPFETYFNEKIKNKIGMEGFWDFGLIYKIYHSNTRSMARFGLLALNKGKWNKEQIIDETFFNACINTSQNINPSYGYLWWLNGKTSFMIPGEQTIYSGSLVPNAPKDMYAAMGKDDQRIYVVPSKKMVVIRMGNAADPKNSNFAVSGFDNELWEKINLVINN